MAKFSPEQLFQNEQNDPAVQLKTTRQLVMLHAAMCKILAKLDIGWVTEIIVQEFSNILSASACFLGWWDEGEKSLELLASHKQEIPGKKHIRKSIVGDDYSLIEMARAARDAVQITNDTQGLNREILDALKENDLASVLILPLYSGDQIIGLVEVMNASAQPYESYEIITARLLADQAAIALENARSYQKAKQEILVLHKAEKSFKDNALYDELTNLPNRVLFMDRLERVISRCKRIEEIDYAVLYIDVDRFRRVNDSLGHIDGDQALQEIAKRFMLSIRESDTVCRFGGDEFLILLDGGLGSTSVKEITDRIQTNLLIPLKIKEREFHFTASIGIAYGKLESTNANEIVQEANLAMYQAKARGGDKVVTFTRTKGLEVKNKVILTTAVREAARKKAFTLNYQPIYFLKSLTIIGMEALLRWNWGDAAISPTQFVPMLEENGLMSEIGLWVLRTAIQKYQNWKSENQGWSQLSLNINISSNHLSSDDFVTRVTEIVYELKMDPMKLNLEITEHALINDLELAKSKILELSNHGIKVYLDDFGTGYSSLSYLSELPVQALKIDQKFVRKINPDELDQGLIMPMIAMARKLNIDVIAEGIETEQHLRGLTLADCKYGQGNFLSPALSEHNLLALLRTSPFSSR